MIFEWNQGKVFSHCVINGIIKSEEYGYVHFQKRKIIDETSPNCTAFYIVPNRFIDIKENLTVDDILQYTKNKLYIDPYRQKVRRIYWYMQHPKALKRKLKLSR